MNPKQIIVFFNLLKACYDAIGLYPSGHPMLVNQYENFLKAYRRYLGPDGKIALSFENNIVSMNHKRLDLEVTRAPAPSWFVLQCQDRKMLHIVFEDGLDLEDIQKFVALLRRKLSDFPDFETASTLLFRQQVQRIQINPVSSLDATFSNLPIFNALPNIEPGGPPAGPADPEADQVLDVSEESFAPPQGLSLFLSREDQESLFQSMSRFINEKKLKKVAESLTLIHRDLKSGSREVRELAYASYHVVVQSLIEAGQNKPLFSIIKSLLPDLQTCKETDLFALHVETLVSLIRYFRDSTQMSPFIYGLNILANLNVNQSGENKKIVEEKLFPLLNPKLLGNLLKNEDPPLVPLLRSLFQQHGLGLVQPLLNALIRSEDRHTRKRILACLEGLGNAIYPEIIAALKTTLKEEQPWFAKRNLLTLLAAKPPRALTPLFPLLLQETHPKVQNLTWRCLFQLRDPQAVALGKKLLLRARSTKLSKLLTLVAAGRIPAYASVVFDLYHQNLEDDLKLEAINTLGCFETRESVGFLIHILGKTPGFGSDVKPEYRVAAARSLAARALAGGGGEEIIAAFAKFKGDKDKAVRAIATEVLSNG